MKFLALLIFSASSLLAESCILGFIPSEAKEKESRPEKSIRIQIQGAGTNQPGTYYLKEGTGMKELLLSDIGTHRLTSWAVAGIWRTVEGEMKNIKFSPKRLKEPEIKDIKLIEGDRLILHYIPL